MASVSQVPVPNPAPASTAPHNPAAKPAAKVPVKISPYTGLFLQSLRSTYYTHFDYAADHFGLTLTRNNVPQWASLRRELDELNKAAPANTEYKVVFIARHGEGWHNVYEAQYGRRAWNEKWAMASGNGAVSWVDAELTEKGMEDARAARDTWRREAALGMPLPEAFYTSPLRRAVRTMELTFGELGVWGEGKTRPVMVEKLRETIGRHTCDKRSSKTELEKQFPAFEFEEGFAEEDELWTVEREPNHPQRNTRLREALEDIFRECRGKTYIAVTAHAGAINSMLGALGNRPWRLVVGATIPVVVKVEYGVEPEPVKEAELPYDAKWVAPCEKCKKIEEKVSIWKRSGTMLL